MDAVVRHRGWLVMLVVLVVVILAVVLGRRSAHHELATGQPAQTRFGPLVPLAPTVRGLAYTNGWMVAADTGRERLEVYAGSRAAHRDTGLLVIVRTDARGRRRTRTVMLRGSGPVMLVAPPAALTTTAAADATVRFLTASGRSGTLALASDRVTF